jgi:putative inorganic carbon (HCO3(-)) transporter
VVAVATVLTGSRGGWIGLFVSLGCLAAVLFVSFWREKPKLRIPIIVALLGAVAAVMLALHFLPSFQQRVSSIFAGSEHSSNAFRINVWRASFRMFKDNWWFGIGPGKDAFVHAYGLYMESSFDALGTYCVPLEVGVECGILGLIAFVCLIGSLLARGHAEFWGCNSIYSTPTLDRWIALGAGIALVGMMVHGFVDTVFYRPQVQFIFWLLVALLTTVPLPHAYIEK